jgi:PHD/YefM family antitoxin component YafN of YafNO toxin-antitoxin module
MPVPPPLWFNLFSSIQQLSTSQARQGLSQSVRYVGLDAGRVVLTTYGQPSGALVSLKDLARLQMLDRCPELSSNLEKKIKDYLPEKYKVKET